MRTFSLPLSRTVLRTPAGTQPGRPKSRLARHKVAMASSDGASLSAAGDASAASETFKVEPASVAAEEGPAGMLAAGAAKATAESQGEEGSTASSSGEENVEDAVAAKTEAGLRLEAEGEEGEEDVEDAVAARAEVGLRLEDEGEEGEEDVGDAVAAKAEAGQRDEDEGEASDESDPDYAAVLERLQYLMSGIADGPPTPQVHEPALSSFDLKGVAELIKSGKARRIICMCGAGISVSAGIPDFRSPGSGLYHRLEAYDLPYPQAVFEIDFFKTNPRPFFLLAKELFPGTFKPTPTHFFMKLLHDKGLLQRCYTQNIDSLEHQAGLPKDAVVAAHGNFDSARCIRCGRPHSVEHVREAVFKGDGHPCYCTHKGCGGLVKPEIVFFGESLPDRFWELVPADFPKADLLIVMGTSLVVQPFASLIDRVTKETPRLLINRERAGEVDPLLGMLGRGFNFDEGNYRDALFEGNCDEGVRELCRLLGWEEELDALIEARPTPEAKM